MKRVTYKVAQALKKRGYKFTPAPCSFFTNETNSWWDENDEELYSFPTYLEVWLWLWREKKINVTPIVTTGIIEFWSRDGKIHFDPEEAIIVSIKHLVDNDLIK